MKPKVIPLRRKGGDQAPIARIDAAAAVLLSEGGTTNLQAARAEVILSNLRLQRDELTTLLLDLRSREATRVPHLDAANAKLATTIDQGIVQIDLLIGHAKGLLERTEHAEVPQPGALRQVLKDV